MKLMICISQLCKGGAERVVVNLANYLSQKNDITVVSFRKGTLEYDIDERVKLVELDKTNTTRFKIMRNIRRFFLLNKLLKNEKYDVVLSFLPKPSYMLLLLKKFRKNRVVVSVRNDPKVEYRSKLNRFLMNWLYPSADGFVFQTKEAQNYFSKSIRKKSIIIVNSVNPNFIVDYPYAGKREKVIVSVGRLTRQKNHLLLVNAFNEVHKKFSNYKLIIYGEGSMRGELENRIRELKLEKFVFLPGVENNIKDKIYKSSLFVLSSDYEGMPNALIEAMCLGIPCISTDCPCGGPRELIKDGQNGFLVEVNNLNMLVEKIINILDGEIDLSIISNNANKLSNKMNPIIINKQWKDYLKKIKDSGVSSGE